MFSLVLTINIRFTTIYTGTQWVQLNAVLKIECRVLELELEQTNNVCTDHAIDTGKQISSADSSNLPQVVQAIGLVKQKNQVSVCSAKVNPQRIKLPTAGKVNWTKTKLFSVTRSNVDRNLRNKTTSQSSVLSLCNGPYKGFAYPRAAKSDTSSVPSSRRFLDRPYGTAFFRSRSQNLLPYHCLIGGEVIRYFCLVPNTLPH